MNQSLNCLNDNDNYYSNDDCHPNEQIRPRIWFHLPTTTISIHHRLPLWYHIIRTNQETFRSPLSHQNRPSWHLRYHFCNASQIQIELAHIITESRSLYYYYHHHHSATSMNDTAVGVVCVAQNNTPWSQISRTHVRSYTELAEDPYNHQMIWSGERTGSRTNNTS